jgi:4-amino-4-deoxy-L-arabinose transferase-like glycosyltransferase
MRTEDSPEAEEPGSRWVLVGVLALLCLMVRMLGLGKGTGALPIFGDEAIYLRWAQLIRAGHWWVSLVDPKPPLHFWLIAGVFDWTRDPLLASRFISVFCGVASVPAMALVCDEVALLTRGVGVSGRILGLLTIVLMVFCPFIAFYQRLGTADALFMMEMLYSVWLALRWGRLAVRGKGWGAAIGLGVAMGAGMMTRQGLSYLLWAIPVVAFVLHGGVKPWRPLLQAILQLVVAGVIAGLLWAPYLIAEFDHFAAERGGAAKELKTRILYQDQFTSGDASRLSVILHNAQSVFVPTWKDGEPETGWLYLYMTPPIYAASLAGLVWLGVRRQWKILALLLVWIGLMLGVPMVLGTVLRSRYIVAGVPPLLLAASFFIAEMLGLLLSLRSTVIGWLLASLLFAGLLILPLLQVAKQGTTWWTQTLTHEDRYQHITGWTAGLATMKAIDFVRNFVSHAPANGVVVLTNDGWGTPADAAWVYLANVPKVTLYYTNHKADYPLLMPAPNAPADTYMVKKDKWLYTPEVPVPIDRQQTVVLYLNNDPVYTADGPVDAEAYFRKFNPNLAKVQTFYNVGAGADRVVLFELTSEKRKNNG